MFSHLGSGLDRETGSRFSKRLQERSNPPHEEYFVCRYEPPNLDILDLEIPNTFVFDSIVTSPTGSNTRKTTFYYLVIQPVPSNDGSFFSSLAQKIAMPMIEGLRLTCDLRGLSRKDHRHNYVVSCNGIKYAFDFYNEEHPKFFCNRYIADRIPDSVLATWKKKWPRLTQEVFMELVRDPANLTSVPFNDIEIHELSLM